MSITDESIGHSVFAQITACFAGLDPDKHRFRRLSRPLQSGQSTGKNLYVVDASEKALARRVPTEILSSHDLFESIFARAALISGVEFFDDHPAVYEAHAKRLHRWMRGDWQLLPRLVGKIPVSDGEKIKTDLAIVCAGRFSTICAAA